MNDRELNELERVVKEIIDGMDEKDRHMYSLKSILDWIEDCRRGGSDSLITYNSY